MHDESTGQTQGAERKPFSEVKSITDIISALASVDSEDANLTVSLSSVLTAQEMVQNALQGLCALARDLDDLTTDALSLSSKVSATAETARRVSDRVKALDEEMRRVKVANDVVGQVIDLKVFVQHLGSVMRAHMD